MRASPNREGKQNAPTLSDNPELTKANLKGDWTNILLLLLLYTMQSLPLGITSVMPFILKNKKNVSYQELALFSLSDWPFSLKLLWAPLVDALGVQKFGRRKSWLVPTQYLIGTILIFTANDIDDLLSETGKTNVVVLSCVFIIMNFLAATQDIAVDGWSLTMLKKNNVGYAPACNLVGHTIGMTSSVVPILFTSESFSNNYIRITPDAGGIVTMKCLLYIWGTMFLLVTTIIAIFKKENHGMTKSGYDHVNLNVVQTYSLVFKILKLPNIRILAIALFTSKIGFAAADSITTLKVIDMGVSKDDILMISTAMFGVNAIITIVFAKASTGLKSMVIFLKAVLCRLFLNIPFVCFIYFSPKLITFNGAVIIPLYYYATFVLLKSIQNMLNHIMMLSSIAFFSRISDPRFGGTYMTLLNTISNLGSSSSATVALGIVDWLTFSECSLDFSNNCSTRSLKNTCETNNGECIETVNGYYVEMALCTVAGIVWYVFFGNIIKNLHTKSPSHWLAVVKTSKKENDKTAHSMSAT